MWEGTDWEEYNKSEKKHLLWTYTSVYEATIEELKNLKKEKSKEFIKTIRVCFLTSTAVAAESTLIEFCIPVSWMDLVIYVIG